MLIRLLFAANVFLLVSCSAGKQVSGVYHTPGGEAQLSLKADSSFEWIYPGDKAVEIGTSRTNRTLLYFAGGKWSMDKSQLVLIPSSDDGAFSGPVANDSISRFTTISSINFWNRFGEQVKIRAIRIAKSQLKPHFGNSLYFFAQDFKRSDTLIFYLEGYRPFTYPGSIPGTIGDNIHKVTLYEPSQDAQQTIIRIKGKRLYANREYYVKKS
ncbi:hypothetical protein LZZ85_27615 [Terrimonas sp. NA20]|uniref:Lipoprotein n=1 Tax=Terrimonas ginsenosidimutans TaxID=2908004 RepID=A0ABS9L0I0_9BACT|nr:hypothetical protein [Terrimonas ginsenosidimutans]MCG2618102.1 hypothetical protein [Terrimonas ginsenosidimutans]